MNRVIKSKLDNWLKTNNFLYVKLKQDESSYYDLDEDIISIGESDKNQSEYFRKYCIKLGLPEVLWEADWKTLVLLHELGHYETLDELSLIEKIGEYVKVFIESKRFSPKSLKHRCNIYYRLPTEKKATEWLILFSLAFTEKVVELDEIMKEWVDKPKK